MNTQSMQPKVKRWQPVYAALLKTGVITTEEIMQIAGVGYKEVWQIITDLTYQCPLYRVSAGVYKLLTESDMEQFARQELIHRRNSKRRVRHG